MTGQLSRDRRALLRSLRAGSPAPTVVTAGQVLVSLRESAGGRRIFCPPPVSGSAYCYLELSRLLSTDVAVDSFAPPGFDDDAPPIESVTALAADCVELILRHQPRGPYLLAGWSFGGVVAFETARQLASRGLGVDLVGLIDAGTPAGLPPPTDAQVREAFVRDLAAMGGQPMPDLAATGSDPGLTTSLREAGLIPAGLGDDFVRRRFAVFRANMRSLLAYRPVPYPGRVAVIRGAQSDEPWRDWTDLATGGAHTQVVPGDHYSMWRPGNVEQLARALDIALTTVDR